KAHRILLPAFSQRAMAQYHPEMLDLASQLALKWARLNPGDLVDVPADMTRLTLDTIGLCGFGYRFNSFYRTDLHPYVQGMVYTLDLATSLLTGGTTEFPQDPELARYRAEMDAFVDEVIAARKALGPAADDKRDLLQFMLTGVDKVTGERLDDVTIRYEINTFLVAGHETTSGLLSFALYFLSKHPDVAARARAEVDRVFGEGTVLPTYEQVRALTYVSQVLKETLRLWPTAPGFARRPLAPDTLAETWAIEPTDVIRVITPLLHRDPSVWGPDAESFDSDNFAPEAEQQRPANAYKPFGTGQRACIGRQFALQEATLVLGMLLHRFELDDAENYQLRIRQTLTIKPEGFHLAIAPRPGRNSFAAGSAVAPIEAAAMEPAPIATTAAGHGAPLLIVFGSNLGSAEDLSYRIANDAAGRGFAPQVAPLDDRVGRLPSDAPVVVVTASYNGTPPDNARAFCEWLQSPDLGADALAGVRYAVFGCGNHEWTATYQAIPRLIDDELAAHGAERLAPRGEGDAAGDFDDQAAAWIAGLWEPLGAAVGLDATRPAETKPLYDVERVSAPANPFLSEAVRPLTVLVNRELQHDSDRSTRHIEVALPQGVSYRTGDHLGIIPRNGVALIARALSHFGFAGDAFVRIRRNGAGTPLLPLDQPIAIVDLLSRYLDLQEVASRAQVATLA
ncbi:MAG TPA: cytochrome P450, partial [Thermomicrobiales bacterium]|nr:cytochrome P450 [Thermomicrobiales bacterium]